MTESEVTPFEQLFSNIGHNIREQICLSETKDPSMHGLYEQSKNVTVFLNQGCLTSSLNMRFYYKIFSVNCLKQINIPVMFVREDSIV